MKKSCCDACGSAGIYPVYHLPRIPAFQNLLFPDAGEARNAAVAEVVLAACPDCGFVFNAAFDNALMEYTGNYQNAQDSSPNFQAHLADVAGIITKTLGPKEKVVEIGAGKAFFFEELLKRGVDAIGFDPAYEGDSPLIAKAYFDEKTAAGVAADTIIMRHTLEHIEAPYAFLLGLKKMLGGHARIFIEVPRLEWIVEHRAFWDIFHEHPNYFSEDFFQGIFSGRAKVHRVFDGQYQLVEAQLSDLRDALKPRPCPKYADLFTAEIARFDALLSRGGVNYIWGAGAKGIAFANILDPEATRIAALIDINPKKQGHFISLTGHACLSPEKVDWAKLSEKDCLFIMNDRYADEILAGLPQIKCRIIVLGQENKGTP